MKIYGKLLGKVLILSVLAMGLFWISQDKPANASQNDICCDDCSLVYDDCINRGIAPNICYVRVSVCANTCSIDACHPDGPTEEYPNCTHDYQCPLDEICSGGVCVPDPY